jgi:hypothetical protein
VETLTLRKPRLRPRFPAIAGAISQRGCVPANTESYRLATNR